MLQQSQISTKVVLTVGDKRTGFDVQLQLAVLVEVDAEVVVAINCQLPLKL